MKKLLLIYLFFLIGNNFVNAQTTLVAGDIAIVGYNADAVPDNFSFIPLKDLAAGTVINFTDFGWRSDINAFQTVDPCGGSTGAYSDGAITWTAPAGGVLFGKQVTVVCGGSSLSASHGTVVGLQANFNFPGEYMSLSPGGDHIFAFQGTLASPTFITAIGMNGPWDATLTNCEFTSSKSVLPAALNATNSMAITTEVDNAKYNCSITSGTASALRTAILNEANWDVDNITPYTLPIACFGTCTDPTVPTVAATTPICAGGSSTLTITGTLNSATQWHVYSSSCGGTLVGTTSGNTLVVSPGTTTNYFVRGEGGCVTPGLCGSATVNVSNLTLTAASQTNIACNGGTTGAATVNTASGGTAPYTYNWTPGNPTGDGTVSVSGLTPGVWTCTVTDNLGCTATQTFTITQPTAITLSALSQTNVSCFGGSNGAASINTPTGGAGGYTYNWTPGNPTGDGTASVTGLTAGTWTCTVTDANACTATQTFTITQPTAITLSALSQTNVSCFGGSNGAASINTPTGGAGGYTYNWTPGNPTGDGTASVTGLAAGTWTCTVTDANACTATQTFTITQPTAITLSALSQTNVSCFGGSNGAASINTPTGGAGGYTYNWTPGNPTGDGTASVTGLAAGTWTCTVTDANACTATQTFTITQPTAITLSALSQTNVSCFGGSNGAASINTPTGGAGGYTYNWTPGNQTGDGTASVTGLAAGTWTCTVTDANACTATQTFTITQPTAITLSALSQTNVSCFGGSNGAASINTPTGGAGGYTYNWTPGNPTGDGTASVTGLAAGTWTCTVTDANACTATQTFTITQPTAITLSALSQTNVSCFGGSNGAASINTPTGGAGGYTYNWTPGNPTGDGTTSVTGLAAGTWTCTVTDANACTATQTFNITMPSGITVTPASQTNVSCFGGTNGAASINTPTGGAGGYTYNWTPGNPTGDGTVSVTGLTAGTWTCTVTDANACTSTQTFTITQPAGMTVTPASQTNVSCFGGSNGAASINTPTGGAGGYTYNWTPGNPTGDGTVSVTGLTAGTWTCTVTDANACTATQTFTITQPTGITLSALSQTNVSCFGGTNGAASINTPTGGAGGYTYNWTPGNPTGDGTTSVTGLAAGTWTCTVTDANACTATQTFTITQPTAITLSALSQTNVSCFGGSNGAASINTPTGGAGGYTYNWTPGNPTGDGTASVTGLAAGTWTCTVTDANACTATQTFTITQPTAITLSALSQTNVSCFGGSNGAASINTPTGGAGGYTYNWTPGNPTGDGTASVTGLAAGTWTCTVTDANACTATQTFTITQPTAITLSALSQTNVSCFGGSNGAASINTPTGGAGGYTYNWTPGNPTGDGTTSVTGLTAGTWTCTVTDANACTATQTFTITQPTAITLSALSQTNVSCFGGSNGAASINTPTGGAGGYTYNWTPGNPTGDGTTSVTGLAAGTWTCTVTDANACTATQTFTITQPTAITLSALSQTNVSCFGGSNGAASINTPTGGAGGYTYNWTPGNPTGDGTISVTGLAAGTWTCTVTDANACTATQTFTITQPTAITLSALSQTNVSCFGGSNGAASINTPTGGAGGYTYNWTPGNPTGDGTTSVTGLTAGTWTCTVTDANACTATQTFTITQPTAITLSALSQTNVSCFGGSNGAASINTPTGGAGGYTYNWTPGNPTGDGTTSVTGLAAGTWTCTVTDANACTATQTFTITQPTAITLSALSQTNVSCFGGSNGAASINTPTGGAGGYTYNWTPGNPTGDGTTSVTGLAAGTWTCTVTDANACTATQTFTITQPTAITLSALSQTNVSCFGGSNGAASINTPTGGAGGYTYNWTPGNPTGDGTASVTGLAAGTWTCTVTDANACTATQTFTITQPTAITLSALSQTNVSCFGGSNGAASINTPTGGAGGYTYNWTPGNPTGDGTASVTGLAAGTWTCTVTDANACTATQTFTITQPTAITLSALSQTNVSCFGGSNGAASINTPTGGAGGYTYNWTPGNQTGDGTASVTGLAAGTWTCTVTDANACTATQTFNITQPTAITLSALSQTNVSCFGGSNGAASINTPTGGAGGYTYNWTPGNPTGDGTASVTGLIAGSWTCTVTDANSCTATQTFNITMPSGITVTPASQTNVSCFGGTNGAASINTPTGGAGGYTYNWTPGNPTGDGTVSVTGLTAGTWTCTVTDANACTATQTFTITQPTAITLSALSQTNVSCFGGSNGAASINTPTGGAGGYTYNWTPGNPTGDGTASVTGLAAGTWTCTVTDANACTATQTFTITQPPAITLSALSQTNVSCFGGSNGAASINTPTGGAGGYTYNWTPGNPTGDGTASVTGLAAGTWTCTVTDANACTATQTFTITQPTAITLSGLSQTNVSCFGGSNGAASINTPTGGAGGYTYNWTPGNPTGDGTASVTGLAAGTWTCTVTDANACTATQTFTITQPTAITLSALSQTNVSCFGGSNGAASINTPTGGAGGYTYNWTPGNPTGDGTTSVTGLAAGTWTCTVTDANACTATQTFTITQPTAITLSALSQTNVSCFGGSNGAASINTPTGGAGGYTYNWTPGNPTGDGTTSVTGLTAGTWTCTVTDANACTATQTFTITQPTAITLSALSQTNVSCFGGSNGAASINTPTGGAGGYTYNWTPGNPTGDGTTSVTGLAAGTWTCTVTDANACTATQTFTITQPTAITLSALSQTNVSCFGGSNGAASINTPTGGAGGYTYNWTPGNPTGDGTISVTGLAAGTWTCTVTDANACTATQTFTITQPTAITLSALSQTNVSCFGGSNGAASINTPTGGAGGYTYNWTPGNPTGDGTTSVTGLTAGTWTCTVTDANACTATQTFTITQPTAITLSALSQTNVSCFGGSNGAASINTPTGGAGGYTYNWTPGNPTGDGTTSVTGLTAGTWTCTVTDANACTATQTFTITQPTAITLSALSQTNVSCFGGSNGAASINTPTGGAGGYTYNWTPGNPTGDGTTSVTGLAAGTWTCTVTDANACTATQTFTITQPTAITLSALSQTNVSCFGGSNGAASINTPTGGAGGYTYNWTPGNPTGDGTASVTGLAAGTWTCTVTDANACTATQTFTITQPTAITLSALSQTNVSCFGGSNGAASINTPTGGAGGYTYNWTPGNPTGDGTTSVTGLAAGTWTCTVTDANACTATQTFTITQPTAITLSALSQTNVSCFGGSNGAATVAASGGNPSYTYLWAPVGGTAAAASGLAAGNYTVTVTDAYSCQQTATVNITQPALLDATISSQTNITCDEPTKGSATVTVSGGTPAYSYSWAPSGGTSATATGLTAGTYTVTVMDVNGCSVTVSTVVTITNNLQVTQHPQNVSICQGNNATFTVQANLPGTTYQWEVNTGSGFIPVVASAVYSGQNSATLSLAFPPLSYNNYKYRCIITLNSCNSTSSEATLSLAGSAEALNIVNVSPISGVYSQTAVAYTVALNKIQSNANVLFKSGNAIELLPGFETKAGVVFATKIESPCGLNTTNNSIFENLPKEIRK